VSRELLVPLFAWLGHTAVGVTIRNSSVLIALSQIIHLLGLTMLIGTVLMVDLTLLGLGIRRIPTARIAAELAPWTTGGLVVMLISGPLILSSETLKCYEASFFWIKMTVLLAAIVFHFTVHRRVARSEPPVARFRAGFVACVSLGLWIGVALAGKMIGIYGDDLRQDPEPFQVFGGTLSGETFRPHGYTLGLESRRRAGTGDAARGSYHGFRVGRTV
jgi:hypothetical protein